jgi:GntR family transcriptional repressor for pyruvate dehydrogenase complex
VTPKSSARPKGEEQVPFKPIQQLRAHEYVAEQIRRHIALRLILPGDALPPERELAEMFDTGRPTIQHALRLLEAERLVTARRGRTGGTFVLAPGDDEVVMEELVARVHRECDVLEDLLEYRGVLEPQVAAVAASARRAEDLRSIRAAMDGMAAATDEADYMAHDTAFHLAIAHATRNRFLEQQSEEIRRRLNDAMTFLPDSDAWHERIKTEHDEIVAAIRARDEARATVAMTVHISNSTQSMRAVLAAMRRRGRRRSGSRSERRRA